MARGLPISTYVDIDTQISAGGVLRTEFGTGLLVTIDDTISAGGSGKARLFSDAEGVTDVFGSGQTLSDALIWFGQPSAKSLYIGRWANVDVATVLRGGTPGAVSALAVSNGTFSIDGADVTLDLSSAMTYAALALVVQGSLSASPVASIAVSTNGTGYTQSTTTVTISGGGGQGATATATVASGAVTAVTVTAGGGGYTSVPTVTIADTGGGTGATADATLGAVTAITTALTGATVSYDAGSFVLTLAGADDVGYFGTHSQGTGEDISGLLGLRQDSEGVTYLVGHDQESLQEAVAEMVMLAQGATPVLLMLGTDAPGTQGTTDSLDALAAYAQAGDYVTAVPDYSAQALVPNDATSRSALIFARDQSHVAAVYSDAGQRPDVGLLSLLSTQSFGQPQSIITPHLKSLPGVLPTVITEADRAELERKRTNVYTVIGGIGALAGGYTGSAGSWLDAIYWLTLVEKRVGAFDLQRATGLEAVLHGDPLGQHRGGDAGCRLERRDRAGRHRELCDHARYPRDLRA